MNKIILFRVLLLIAACMYTNSSFSQDTDGDGVDNSIDIDDDNDGIPDTVEDANCAVSNQSEASEIYRQDFGTGAGRFSDPNVLQHTFKSGGGAIPDGSYAVVTSNTSGLGHYNRTNDTGNLDANIDAVTGPAGGSTEGRYLSINMNSPLGVFEFYRQSGLSVEVGRSYRFRVDMAGLCSGCADIPNFTLQIQDSGGAILESITSTDIGVLNDDIWRRVVLNFTATTATISIVLVNSQVEGGAGNDVGVDNIVLASLVCDSDNDGIPDHIDIDADNDGIPDNVEVQQTIGYVAPSSSTGGVMTDTNNNGLDDVYESALGGIDLNAPVDTDGDGIMDYLDTDSDNDLIPDIEENGMANTLSNSDIDGDGLDDNFETNGVNDSFLDANEDIEDPTDLTVLPDIDGDRFTGGDLDYRDYFDGNPPPIATVDFDGVDDYLSRGSIVNGLDEVTIMAWVKSDSGNSSDMVIVGENIGCQLSLSNGNKPTFKIKSAGNSVKKVGDCSCSVINFDEWHHIAGSFSSVTGVIKLYVDGVLVDDYDTGNIGDAIEVDTDANGTFEIGRFSDKTTNEKYFKGDIDEVRVFGSVLTESQIQRMVYQEIENNGGNVKGSVVAKDITDSTTGSTVAWAQLLAYYPMTEINASTILDYSNFGRTMRLHNITTIEDQTAPMPYVTTANGAWTTQSTWLHGDVWDIESIADNKDWSVVKIANDITASHPIKTLGLIIDANKTLTVNSENQVENTWYLQLNGTLDLEDDSQLIQTITSDLVTSSSGKILRRQEGSSNAYRYNYWSSPVGATGVTSLTDNNAATNNANNTSFQLNMIKDEAGVNLTFTNGYNQTGKISTYWLYTFMSGLTYWDWALIGPGSSLTPGIGYTQKGTGNGGLQQQYIFEGKPNNGTILVDVIDRGGSGSVTSVSKTEYLLGNPYPSALDVNKFIDDNVGVINGTLQLWQQWSGNSHNLSAYEGGYAQVNKLGSCRAYQFVGFYGATNGSLDGTVSPSKYLPIGQGFITEVVADGTVVFNNSQRVFVKESDADGGYNNGASFFKSSNSKSKSSTTSAAKQQSSVMTKIRLEFNSVVGPKTRRELLMGFSEATSDGYDYGYEAYTTENSNNDFNLDFEGRNMNMQAYGPITKDKVVALNFKSSGNNTFDIKATEFENIDVTQEVYLRDNLTEEYFDLTQDTTYRFSSTQGKFNSRFEIVFQSKSQLLSNEDVIETDNNIYYQNKTNTLYAKNLHSSVSHLALINMRGQTIMELANVSTNQLQNGIPFGVMAAGAYVVCLRTVTNEVLTKKIIIK
ncbi:LamG domain-containing protein [Mariniflexile sp. AS56]|uniref:LamG domain-containing protein n=1 Tax=Mariniflexile sp. AS56 TaxID=3063957 RepID=UPI0026F3340A|nr:LamG-like jellyroll fold domain-containing protein [Mariniflexile sp. AS56]MDO7171060.1 LamG-like jellyroll fold domain-containing protein [Mariniflexile sp. AS56]